MNRLRDQIARQPTAPVTVAVGLFVLGLYVSCLCPTVYWSDAGELIVSSVEPGIAHPNGSPLYTILGWLCSHLPFGPVAWRVGLLSALSAAAAVAVVVLAIRRCAAAASDDERQDGWALSAASIAALALAVAPGLWQKAETVNKYPLALLACTVGLLAYAVPGASPLWLGLVLGAGYAVHPYTLCLAPLALLTLARVGRGQRLAALGRGALGAVLGLLPFLYLPLRSLSHPANDWGHPATWSGFWWVVRGEEFRGFVLGAPRWEWLPNAATAARVLLRDLGLPALLLGSAGAALGLARSRPGNAERWLVAGLLLVALADLILVATYDMTTDRYTWNAYLLPLYAVVAVSAGMGIVQLRRLPGLAGRGLTALGLTALLISVGVTAHRAYPLADKSQVWAARDFARELHAALPPDAVLVHNTSEVEFLLAYLAQVERQAPATTVYLPVLVYPWYGEQLRARHPGLAVPEALVGAGRDFIAGNHERALYAYPGGLGKYVPNTDLTPAGVLLRAGAPAAVTPATLVPERLESAARAADSDGRTVSAYVGLLHAHAVWASDRGDAALCERVLAAAISLGAGSRARHDDDVAQALALCRLTHGTLLAAQHRYADAQAELKAAFPLATGKLRAERDVRLALLSARSGGEQEVVDLLRRALRADPTHPMARQLTRAVGLSP